ncbi:hypothetical protein FA13DRAFT_1737797 [Coprinellus micaceus]|uniref:DUF6699 domain-containing protein n=1 Tax=Coprinellus micaceus TaxID=71717 RepID=A0A4Y7SWY5_COPMI|nr:hypothetical protein FA13DRAFT_1737797 [Coprinellus micaceus]
MAADMNWQIAQANHQMNTAFANANVAISRASNTMASVYGPPMMPPPPPIYYPPPPPVILPPPPPVPHRAYSSHWSPPPPRITVRAPSRARVSVRVTHSGSGSSSGRQGAAPFTPPSAAPPWSVGYTTPDTDVWEQPPSPGGSSIFVLPDDSGLNESRPSTPPPPAHDSWAFVDERFRSSQDSSPPPPRSTALTTELEARHRRTRRKRAPPSIAPALTFYRYGPPSTKAETNLESETVVSPESKRGAKSSRCASLREEPGSESRSSLDNLAIIRRGDKPENDTFQPPVGNPKKIKRPTDWRPEWNRRTELRSLVPIFIRRVSSSGGGNDMPDTKDRCLTATIEWGRFGKDANLDYDLRSPPKAPALKVPATTPSASWMRLYHPALPWYIDVESSRSRGITVLDVVQEVHNQLMIPLTERDMWNEGMNEEMRKSVAQSVRSRTGKSAGGKHIACGLKPLRLDFLGNNYIFEGLVKGTDGMWEIKTRDWRA